ncbi:MAG: hypothetical protein HN348_18035, partial [Proteobacteria bacterium]|nr:hypothetical protein [Pseudomonadota bacterium]
MEEFALATDRQKALEQLIPGTEDYYWYSCLHRQHKGQFDAAAELLSKWRGHHGRTSRYRQTLNRQRLLTWENEPKATLKHIRDRLSLRFDHQREVEGQETKLESKLKAKQISRQAFDKHTSSLDDYVDTAFDWLIDTDLSAKRSRLLLKRLQRPDYANLVNIIIADFDHRPQNKFGDLEIHHMLLKDQLDELGRKRPELLEEAAYVHAYISRLQPNPDVNFDDVSQRGIYLDRLWNFVSDLATAFNSLKAHVLYHRLDLDRSRGVLDRKRLVEYLKLPRQVSYLNSKYKKQAKAQDSLAHLGNDFQTTTLLPTVHNDEQLVRHFLAQIFVEADDHDDFKKYLDDTWLKRLFATTKLLAGVGDMEKWYKLLADRTACQTLKERVDIEFLPVNKPYYRAEEPVSLSLAIKNVETLMVKVFEINTRNYYGDQQREVDTAIDLDGMVAAEERTFTYDKPPMRRVEHSFDFPSLSHTGVFVVEFIGNGRSSRAVIRKGGLRCLERIGAAGHVFVVLDEANRPMKDATIRMAGREYHPRTDGSITIPFSTNPGRQTILICHREQTTLDHFFHRSETYTFSAGIYVDRESLVKGHKAKVLVKPMLKLQGTPISLTLVEQPVLMIESEDQHGVSSSREVLDFQLEQRRESTFEFQVPERLARISFSVKGKVKCLSTGETIHLSDSAEFSVNGIDQTDKVHDLHLNRTQAGFVLELLGKSGEPRPQIPINLEFRHADFVNTNNLTLKTDTNGYIELGDMGDIQQLGATTPDGVEERWDLAHDSCQCPNTIQAPTGEVIALPYMGSAKKPLRSEFSLLETRGGSFLADHFSALRIKGGFLELTDLPAGDYSLLIKKTGIEIDVHVTAASQIRSRWLASGHRLLERRHKRPLQIHPVEIDAEQLSIKLINYSKQTRLHLLGTRFVPPWSVAENLGAIHQPQPQLIEVAQALSHYLSGRDIGDEYRYILERRYAKKFTGNTLERPGLLLNPWAVRTTDTATDQAVGGASFASRTDSRDFKKKKKGKRGGKEQELHGGGFQNLDFLTEATVVLANLRPDEGGFIKVDREKLGAASHLRLLAVDGNNSVYREVTLDEAECQFEDLRLLRNLNAEGHFTEKKEVT